MSDICTPKTSPQILYETCLEYYGKDVSLDQTIPNEVQCAEAVSFILEKAGFDRPGRNSDIPDKGIPGTWTLYQFLKNNPLFRPWMNEDNADGIPAGVIIISPAGTSSLTPPYPHGHVGITGKNGEIFSNDSSSGLFLTLFDMAGWEYFFEKKRGLKTFLFEPL